MGVRQPGFRKKARGEQTKQGLSELWGADRNPMVVVWSGCCLCWVLLFKDPQNPHRRALLATVPVTRLSLCNTYILHLGFKLKHTLFKKNNEDTNIYRCSDINVGRREMVGRGEGMKEKCFLKGNPAPACLQGDPCHPFQANCESAWWSRCLESTSSHLYIPAQIMNARKQAV